MLLRNRADRRSLLWALGLFPAVPTIGYAWPQLVPWLLPVSLYLSYCAGALAHYHNHLPVFLDRRLNKAYGAWLSLFYGYPTFAWIPTHNHNHHRYVNGSQDATRTTRSGAADGLLTALAYPFLSAAWQAPAISAYIRTARRERPARYREIVLQYCVVAIGHAGLLALALALHGPLQGALTYGLLVALPAMFASWSMMFTNYVQHVDCDPSSPDDHSRNFVSPIQNWLVFDAGFHTVHHEKPGAHWSQYRRMHEERAARIDPSLNESSIFGFCFKRYFLRRLRRSVQARTPFPAE